LPQTLAEFSAPGVYVLRLTASDGALTAQDEVTVTIGSDGFSEWKARIFTAGQLSDPNISGDAADPDGDGHTNLQEFEAGTHPMDAQSVLKVDSVEWNGTPGEPVTLRFPAMPDKTYTVQFQEHAGAPWLKLSDIAPQATAQLVEVKDSGSSQAGARLYRIVTPQQP
jgi:hypothetical protein